MYKKKQIIRKLLLGILLLAAAVLATLFIRENLEIRSPEQALPSLTITLNKKSVFPQRSVFRAGYEWSFFTSTAKHTPPYSTEDILLSAPPVRMEPRTLLDISFSVQPKKLQISRADQADFSSFMQLADLGTNSILTPSIQGLYLYQLEADFGWRGSIVYFFTVQIDPMIS